MIILSASCYGDPHITTLDRREYTFNGWGEYTYLSTETNGMEFVVQARTELVVNSTATQFSAFVFGIRQTNTSVQV